MTKNQQRYIVGPYETADGKSPFSDWFESLPTAHAEKVQDALNRMALGNLGDSKSVKKGVFERRIKNPVIRIYYGMDGDQLILLLHGGTKRRQSEDIEYAQTLWAEYKKRKKELKNSKK